MKEKCLSRLCELEISLEAIVSLKKKFAKKLNSVVFFLFLDVMASGIFFFFSIYLLGN